MADTPSPLSVAGPLSPAEFDKRWIGAAGAELYERAEKAQETAAKKQEEIAKRYEARRPGEEQEMEAASAGVEKALGRPRPGIPSQERVPSPPKPEDYQKMSMEYLGAMVLLGAFGGRFIRNAANAPLSAFAGAMKGWQEGNLEAYKNKSAEWEQKQKQVLENNRAKLEEYRTILEDRNASIQDQMFRVRMVAAKHQDRLMYDRADAENFTGVAQAYEKMTGIQEKAEKATQALVDQLTQDNATAIDRANQTKQYLQTPQGQQWYDQFTPGQKMQLDGWLDAYADKAPAAPAALEPPGEIPAATAPTARMPPDLRGPIPAAATGKQRAERAFRQRIWTEKGQEPDDQDWARFNRTQHQPRTAGALALQEYIEETIAETGKPPSPHELIHFNAEVLGEAQYGRTAGGMAARSAAATDEVAMAVPLALQSSRNLPRGRLVPLNQLLQMWEKGTSDKRYNDFVVKNVSLLNAYVRAMNPQGNPRIAERMEAHSIGLLSMATDAASYETQVRALWQEVINQRAAIKKTRAGEPGSDEFPEPPPPAGGAGGGSVIKYDAEGNRIR